MKLLALAAVLLLLPGCIDVSDGEGGLFEPEPCVPALEPDIGEFQSQWTRPATIGASEREWQPAPFHWADAEHLERLDRLEVALEWTNTPQAAADFGIAIGRDGAFRYWNQAYQASLGAQREEIVLDRSQLAEHGWTSGDHLDGGPSVSTGAYSATSPISYKLSWTATFQPPPEGEACGSEDGDGDGARTVTASSTVTAAPQAPGRGA